MDAMSAPDAASSFEPLRPRLTRAAYQLLGSVADAEDAVQEAFLRWHSADRAAVQSPEAYLLRTVTHLCLDVLKSARHQRDSYPGPWLPEPVLADEPPEAGDITLPVQLVLERLSPLERAAFLLHDVFELSFDEIGATLGRDSAACRQLASRARTNVRTARPRFEVPPARQRELADAFYAATHSGDTDSLRAMLASDVSMYADGGGKRPAAPRPLLGHSAVMRTLGAISKLLRDHPSQLLRTCWINGLPGFVTLEGDGVVQTTAVELDAEGQVSGVYVVRNPEKLGRVRL